MWEGRGGELASGRILAAVLSQREGEHAKLEVPENRLVAKRHVGSMSVTRLSGCVSSWRASERVKSSLATLVDDGDQL